MATVFAPFISISGEIGIAMLTGEAVDCLFMQLVWVGFPPSGTAIISAEFLCFPTGVLSDYFTTLPTKTWRFISCRSWHTHIDFVSAAVGLDCVYGYAQ